MDTGARRVFVSYSQSDKECAYELVAQVEAAGLPCWIAPRDISPAADWAEEIIDAIGNAQIMVLVFSASSNESPQVRREVERAVHKRIGILPFRIENVLPSRSLEYFLSAQQWFDAFDGARPAHYARLSERLRSMMANSMSAPRSERDLSAITQSRAMRQFYGTAQIQQIEAALATYVGPMARILVKRAASTAATVQELVQGLALEVEPGARAKFIDRCSGIQ